MSKTIGDSWRLVAPDQWWVLRNGRWRSVVVCRSGKPVGVYVDGERRAPKWTRPVWRLLDRGALAKRHKDEILVAVDGKPPRDQLPPDPDGLMLS